MRLVVRLSMIAAAFYMVVLFALFALQRRLMYFPSLDTTSAAAAALPKAKVLRLETTDNERIVAWYQPAGASRLLYIYFHGNGGSLVDRADLFRRLASDGSGFLAIDYRGYGGSTGSPTEKGLLLDGEAAYREAISLGYSADRIVIVGESLGTAVAVSVAAGHPSHALILDSAFSSTADVAAAQFWWFPVRFLMRDTFDSLARIAHVKAAKLFLHGSSDTIIPVSLARRLFEAAPSPKQFIELAGRGHVVLGAPHVLEHVRAWLASIPAA